MAQGGKFLDQSKPGAERNGKPAEPTPLASPGGEPGEFTRMFHSLGTDPQGAAATAPGVAPMIERAPSTAAAPEPAPVTPSSEAAAAPSAGSAGSEGFTQIFQQIRKPTSAPPEIRKPDANVVAPSSEGFTQIFSSFQAGLEPALPAAEPARVPVAPVPEHRLPTPVAQTSSAAFASPSEAAKPSTPASAPVFGQGSGRMENPGAFTQLFEQVGPVGQPSVVPPPNPPRSDSVFGAPAPAGSLTETFRSTPAGQAPAPAQPAKDNFGRPGPPFATPAAEPAAAPSGSFTEMFRSPATQAPAQAGRDDFGKSGTSFAAPATSSPAASPGSFTEMFRSPVAPQVPAAAQPGRDDFGRPAAPFAAPPAPATAPSGDSSFTQLFQSLSANPAAAAPQIPVSAQPREPAFGSAAGPVFPAQSAAAPAPAAGGGEFTRLMQSLEQPAATPSAAQQPAAPLPFFAEAPQASGASEFTRVMRGPGFRDGGAARPTPAVASAPVAPGMAIAPGKVAEKKETEPAGKSKKMVMLLVIINVILVIAVILLAVFLLRRH